MVAALIAPRPLLIISGRKDLDFPPDGYHEVFRRSKKIYDFYAPGDSDRIREVDDDVGHSDPPQFLREARQWMRRWLQNESAPLGLETNAPPRETAEDLACLSQLPADAVNYRIQNQLTSPVSLKQPLSRTAWNQRRSRVAGATERKGVSLVSPGEDFVRDPGFEEHRRLGAQIRGLQGCQFPNGGGSANPRPTAHARNGALPARLCSSM